MTYSHRLHSSSDHIYPGSRLETMLGCVSEVSVTSGNKSHCPLSLLQCPHTTDEHRLFRDVPSLFTPAHLCSLSCCTRCRELFWVSGDVGDKGWSSSEQGSDDRANSADAIPTSSTGIISEEILLQHAYSLPRSNGNCPTKRKFTVLT